MTHRNFFSRPLFFGVSLIAALFIGCAKESASDVNQDKIHTEYELFYDANTDKTTAIARFRFGGVTGTLLELDSDDKVLFNDDELTYSIWWGAHVREYAGQVTSGTFKYTNLNDQVFENSAPAYEAIAFPADFTTIQKGQANNLEWDGTSLSPGQDVGLFIGTWTWGQDALYYTNTIGATNLVLGMVQVNNLAVGAATCIMDRATVGVLSEATPEGGVIRSKYRAMNKQVQVVE